MISNLTFRLAMESDLPEIMRLIKSDLLTRESERSMDPMPDCYLQAFRAIDASPDNELIVACLEDAVVGCLQITYIHYLANYGRLRATIEAVRVDSRLRSRGIGSEMMRWAIERAHSRKCIIVQLTSDKRREDAHRFYRRLGFSQSHEGFKIRFPEFEE